MIIDPSLELAKAQDVPAVDSIVISHCHEDHLAGLVAILMRRSAYRRPTSSGSTQSMG